MGDSHTVSPGNGPEAPSRPPATPDQHDLAALTTVVHRALRAPAFIISIVGGQLPTLASGAGMPDYSPDDLEALLGSLCLGAATARETLVVHDAELEGAASGLTGLGGLGVRSCICIPLRLDGWRIRGLLCVIDESPRDWSDEAFKLVEDVAQVAAMEMRVEAGMQTLTQDSRQLGARRALIEGFLAGEERGAGVDGVLASLGTTLDWDAASLWLCEGPSTLRCVGGWAGIAIPAEPLAELWADQSPIDERDLLSGVLSHQQPVWMPDIETRQDSHRARLALAAGLASALWFPIRSSGGLGAVELLSSNRRSESERMPLLENSLGRLIGSLLALDWRAVGGPQASPSTPLGASPTPYNS